uniref:Uncharacterized protein n=1 Tax=Arundo donax TaxID=35708 RepID=A0A0A8YST5_ARUDO
MLIPFLDMGMLIMLICYPTLSFDGSTLFDHNTLSYVALFNVF